MIPSKKRKISKTSDQVSPTANGRQFSPKKIRSDLHNIMEEYNEEAIKFNEGVKSHWDMKKIVETDRYKDVGELRRSLRQIKVEKIKEVFETHFGKRKGFVKETMITALSEGYFRQVPNFLRRETEFENIQQAGTSLDIRFLELCGRNVPKELMVEIFSYLLHDQFFLFNCGAVNSNWYFVILMNWTYGPKWTGGIQFRKEIIHLYPILVLQHATKIAFIQRNFGLAEFNHVKQYLTSDRIVKFDISHSDTSFILRRIKLSKLKFSRCKALHLPLKTPLPHSEFSIIVTHFPNVEKLKPYLLGETQYFHFYPPPPATRALAAKNQLINSLTRLHSVHLHVPRELIVLIESAEDRLATSRPAHYRLPKHSFQELLDPLVLPPSFFFTVTCLKLSGLQTFYKYYPGKRWDVYRYVMWRKKQKPSPGEANEWSLDHKDFVRFMEHPGRQGGEDGRMYKLDSGVEQYLKMIGHRGKEYNHAAGIMGRRLDEFLGRFENLEILGLAASFKTSGEYDILPKGITSLDFGETRLRGTLRKLELTFRPEKLFERRSSGVVRARGGILEGKDIELCRDGLSVRMGVDNVVEKVVVHSLLLEWILDVLRERRRWWKKLREVQVRSSKLEVLDESKKRDLLEIVNIVIFGDEEEEEEEEEGKDKEKKEEEFDEFDDENRAYCGHGIDKFKLRVTDERDHHAEGFFFLFKFSRYLKRLFYTLIAGERVGKYENLIPYILNNEHRNIGSIERVVWNTILIPMLLKQMELPSSDFVFGGERCKVDCVVMKTSKWFEPIFYEKKFREDLGHVGFFCEDEEEAPRFSELFEEFRYNKEELELIKKNYVSFLRSKRKEEMAKGREKRRKEREREEMSGEDEDYEEEESDEKNKKIYMCTTSQIQNHPRLGKKKLMFEEVEYVKIRKVVTHTRSGRKDTSVMIRNYEYDYEGKYL